jgi:hypothetical protein
MPAAVFFIKGKTVANLINTSNCVVWEDSLGVYVKLKGDQVGTNSISIQNTTGSPETLEWKLYSLLPTDD